MAAQRTTDPFHSKPTRHQPARAPPPLGGINHTVVLAVAAAGLGPRELPYSVTAWPVSTLLTSASTMVIDSSASAPVTMLGLAPVLMHSTMYWSSAR